MRIALYITLSLFILLASTAAPTAIHPSLYETETKASLTTDENITTQSFAMARIVMPATTDLVMINNGFLTESGFAGPLNINFGYGIIAKARLMVLNDTLAVEPLTRNPVILNPGDNLTVLIGTFHFLTRYPDQEPPKGYLVGRFYGVTVEQHT